MTESKRKPSKITEDPAYIALAAVMRTRPLADRWRFWWRTQWVRLLAAIRAERKERHK